MLGGKLIGEVGRLAAGMCRGMNLDPSRAGEVVFRYGGKSAAPEFAAEGRPDGTARLVVTLPGAAPEKFEEGDSPAPASEVGAKVMEVLGLPPDRVRGLTLSFAAGGAVLAHVERYVTLDEAARLVAGPLPVLASKFAWATKGKVVRTIEEVPHTELPKK
jgi:hypothetical protein